MNLPGAQLFLGDASHFPLEKFLGDFKIPASQAVLMEQVHGDRVAVIDALPSGNIPGVDAVLTQNPGICLIVRTADCVPILLAENSGWVGIVHAGRRGTQAGILQKTLEQLKKQGGDLSQTFLFLGPAISFESYEINPETHAHYDLNTENLKQAVQAGVPSPNISFSGICTFKDRRYPSYRRDGTTQRFFSAIARRGAKI